MDSCFYEMAARLKIEGVVRRAVEAGQDQNAIQDIVFGLFCQLLGNSKTAMRHAILDQDMPRDLKLLALTAIDRDVNYLWD